MSNVNQIGDHREKDDCDPFAEFATNLLIRQLEMPVVIRGVKATAAAIMDYELARSLIRGAFRGIIKGSQNASK